MPKSIPADIALGFGLDPRLASVCFLNFLLMKGPARGRVGEQPAFPLLGHTAAFCSGAVPLPLWRRAKRPIAATTLRSSKQVPSIMLAPNSSSLRLVPQILQLPPGCLSVNRLAKPDLSQRSVAEGAGPRTVDMEAQLIRSILNKQHEPICVSRLLRLEASAGPLSQGVPDTVKARETETAAA